uniref:Uncharacterized protein n=1 Tax=Phytophthora fragariae TaxID=53985 RepID=A0A6A3DCW5_9STRA|nr:hypothetical protein PF009_g30140 [Phytophthora fragariae]
MNGPRRICAKRISRLISEFALSSERRDSRQPATTLIGAGWCFHYTKVRVRAAGRGRAPLRILTFCGGRDAVPSFKATWHSVARGDVGLKEIDHNVDRGGVVLPLHQGKLQGNRA